MKAAFEIHDLYRSVKARSALEGRLLRVVAEGLFRKWRTIDVLVGNLEAPQAADQSNWAPLMEIWESRLTPKN